MCGGYVTLGQVLDLKLFRGKTLADDMAMQACCALAVQTLPSVIPKDSPIRALSQLSVRVFTAVETDQKHAHRLAALCWRRVDGTVLGTALFSSLLQELQ